MTYSNTTTESNTFTISDVKHIGMKVITDLKRIQRLYGEPNELRLHDYSIEILMLLDYGFLESITYGFEKNRKWIEPTLRYTFCDLQNYSLDDDDPGRIRFRSDISGATFTSCLSYNNRWSDDSLSKQRKKFEREMPFQRVYGSEPPIDGRLVRDRTYSSSRLALGREVVRSCE